MVPIGIGRGIRLEVEAGAPLHMYVGTWEMELAPYLRALIRPGTLCFDVGGHDGYYAMLLARLSGAETISFEFDERNVALMRRNLALNPSLAKRVLIHRTYVAHERAESPRADTLDHLIAGREVFVPDMVKIDVEGAETSVLAGASHLLVARKPHLIIETHSESLEQDCVRLLEDVGYRPAVVDQRRWLREHRGSGHNRWLVARGREKQDGRP